MERRITGRFVTLHMGLDRSNCGWREGLQMQRTGQELHIHSDHLSVKFKGRQPLGKTMSVLKLLQLGEDARVRFGFIQLRLSFSVKFL